MKTSTHEITNHGYDCQLAAEQLGLYCTIVSHGILKHSLNLLNFNNSDTANCVRNSCIKIDDSVSEPADSWFYVERTGALSEST